MMKLPALYAIADAGLLESRGLDLRTFAVGLRAAGVTLVQWRAKDQVPATVLAGAGVLREVFASPEGCLIMNDRVDLALLAGCDGVHVGQGDLPVAAIRAVLEQAHHPLANDDRGWSTRIVGVSTHAMGEVREADQGTADYVAIGPVFATGTKRDAAAVVGLDGVRRARELTCKPLVAIGGITLQNARSVLDAGADSVAVISGLLVEGRTVEETARDFFRILR